MAVVNSPKVELGVTVKGIDKTKGAMDSAGKNVDKLKEKQKSAMDVLSRWTGMSGKSLTKMAFSFNMVTEAASRVTQAFVALRDDISAQAESVAMAENAWGSYDNTLQALAKTGGAMSIDTFSKFTTILRNTGIDVELTGAQVDKLGSLAASMGKDSDEAFEGFAASVAKGNLEGLQGIGIYANMEIELRNIAKSSGRSTDSFSHQERQTIALKVAMRELEGATVRGGAAFAQMDQLGRNMGNAMDRLKANTLVPLGNYVAENLNVLFDEFGNTGVRSGVKVTAEIDALKRSVDGLSPAIDRAKAAYEAFLQKGRDAGRRNEELLTGSDVISKINKAQKEIELSTKDQVENAKLYKKTQGEVLSVNAQVTSLEKKMTKIRADAAKSQKAQFKNLGNLIKKKDEEIAKATELMNIARGAAVVSVREGSGGKIAAARRLAELEEERMELQKQAGKIIVEQKDKEQKAEAQITKILAQKEKLVDAVGDKESSLEKLKQAQVQIEETHRTIVQKRVGLLKAIQEITLQIQRSKLTTLQQTKSVLEMDMRRFGANKSGLQMVASLEATLYNERRRQAIESAKRQRESLKLEVAKLQALAGQSQAKFRQAVYDKEQAKGELLYMRAGGAPAKQLAAQQKVFTQRASALEAMRELMKSSNKAYFETVDAFDASKGLVSALEGTRADSPEKARRRMRGGSKARKKDSLVSKATDSMKEETNLAKRRIALAGELLNLQEQQLINRDAFTAKSRIAFVFRRRDVELQKLQSEYTTEQSRLLDRSIAIEERIAKITKTRKLTAEEALQVDKTRKSIIASIALGEDEYNARRQLAIEKARKTVSDIESSSQEEIKRKMQAVRQELGLVSPLEQARANEVEQLKEINRLKLLGLTTAQEETALEQANSEKRLAFFDQLTGSMSNAVSMAGTIDQIAQKYAALGAASDKAGEMQLSSGQTAIKSTAMFLGELQKQQGAINKTINAFATANKKGTKGYAQAAEGAIMVGGALASSVIDDEQTKAAVLAAMEGAAAVAAFAGGNIAGGIGHTASAALYAAVAGTAKQGASASTETDAAQVRAEGGQIETGPGQTIVNINAPVISGTQAETGAMIGQWIQEAKGAGYGG